MELKTVDDTIDRIVGLSPDLNTYTTRHQREKVAVATQGSEHALFDPALAGVTLCERLCVAWYACILTPSTTLAEEYLGRLVEADEDDAVIAHIQSGQIEGLASVRLRAMLTFTQTLITDPVKADQTALFALKSAGLTTPEIVTLAQLIAFISYQVRLAAGLRAMQALEQQR